MNKLSLCRICLTEDVKMYSLINAKLQELYEKLTEMPFVSKDERPVQVCYLCHARLQNCHRLQLACLKSEEFLNKVIADIELNEMELHDLNTLKTVHPLVLISCVPSTRKDPEIDEDNDFKFDPLEITSDVQIKHELFEDDSNINMAADIISEGTHKNEDICTEEDSDILDNSHTMQDTELEHDIHLKIDQDVSKKIDFEYFKTNTFTNKEVYIQSEGTVEEENNCAEDGDMSDNRHTMQNTELEHDIHLKTVKIVLERIDLEQFKIGEFADKKKKLDLLNGNPDSTTSTQPQTEVTVVQNNNIEEKIHTIEKRPALVQNKNIVEQKSVIVKWIKKENIELTNSIMRYGCIECGKSYSRMSDLLRHTRSKHTGESSYKCNICERSFISNSDLQSHSRVHTIKKPYKCNICEKSFSGTNGLLNHTRVHTDDRSYKCNLCEKSYTKFNHLVNHTLIHTSDRPFQCNICEQSFITKRHLQLHSRVHTGEKPYKCNICEKSFSQTSVLVIHTRRHTGERPYKCNVCGKGFVSKTVLVTHSRSHTGEKPYVCKICTKSFPGRSALVRHFRVHAGERSHRCNITKRRIVQKVSLVKRTFSHSAERQYRCDICDKSIKRKKDLITHINIHMKSRAKCVM